MKNKVIALAKAAYYQLTEPVRLLWARLKYGQLYYGPDDYTTTCPCVSIYCPTYNRKELLMSRAVKSVLSQTYQNWELIIANDGSTDGTREAVRDLMLQDKRIRLVNVERSKKRYPETPDNHWFCGPVVAANHALKHCRGRWIARIDDDDVWTPNHLESLLNMAHMLQAEFISSAYETPDGVRMADRSKHEQGGASSWLYRSYLSFFRYNIDCWRKSNNRVNDLDLADRMRKAGVKMRYFPFVTYSIMPRPGET